MLNRLNPPQTWEYFDSPPGRNSIMDTMAGPTKAALERAGRLRAIRERVHGEKSQRAFAARLGVSQARYNHWERGWPIPSDQIRKIKDITPGVDADYILWGDIEGLSLGVSRLLLEETPTGPPAKPPLTR